MWYNLFASLLKLMQISMIFSMLKELIVEWRLLSPIRDRLNALYQTAIELKNYVMG